MSHAKNGTGPLGNPLKQPVNLLVCFAAKVEAMFFLPPRPEAGTDLCQVWITEMGRHNAAESIRSAISSVQPERVITSGFAGGLNPALKFGTVVFDEDFDAGFGKELERLGAVPAKFHCHRRVAITTTERLELWRTTGADAVEMESSVIRTICREQKIPSATIRVISDDSSQDLPLDFNALMTSDDRIDYFRLIRALISRPSRIPRLLAFQQQTVTAARRLGTLLEDLLRAERS